MWFLLFFIFIPFILFIGFLLFGIFIIFLINRIFHKKYSQYFSLILPCFSLIFYFILIMGGISFKYVDPQYYEFKGLCKEAKDTIYDEELYRIYKALDSQRTFQPSYYDEKTQKKYLMSDFEKKRDSQQQKISGKITEYQNMLYYKKNENPFLHDKNYYYRHFGIFLKGDEGGGFYIDSGDIILECKDLMIPKDF
ncbi:hypothetical protein XJ32_02980 [Helicobacter bilis]|uniref:Uncharacterized protein n=3 Tax=Helicobacter bilis TaxID=37372 RepID=C3XIN4_9HELI|nr:MULTISPECIES: hypothetical protein [Helicobacter]AQQ59231.1 hypothetical protein XJ32_02980 [Helicobacter bilis]EEO24873.1 hypothetical protein HRAG_01930 [Helicobacter bilis ATCC 43879]